MSFIIVHSFYTSWLEARGRAYVAFDVMEGVMESRLEGYLQQCQEVSRKAGYATAVQRYLLSDNPTTVISSFDPAMEQVMDAMQLGESFSNIYLYADTGRYLCANRNFLGNMVQVLDKRFFTGDLSMSKAFYTTIRQDGNTYMLYCAPIYSVLSVGASNPMVCVIFCDLEEITTLSTVGGQDGVMALLYRNSVISATRDLTAEEARVVPLLQKGQGSYPVDGVRYLGTRVNMDNLWDFIYVVPEREITAHAYALLGGNLFPLFLASLLIAALMGLLLLSVNRSVTGIVSDFNRLEYSGPSHTVRTPGLVELRDISRSANHMLDRLETAFQAERAMHGQLLEAVTARSRAEMLGYRSQINPHFLFNTLECMRSMANSSGDRSMEEIVSSMALLFRYSLYSKAMSPLSQELTHAQHFVNVMNIRFGGRYLLKLDVADPIKHRLVPSMILQPLVENAIRHGFADLEEGIGTILIQALVQKEGFILRVADNGKGMEPEEIQQRLGTLQEPEKDKPEFEESIGLQNIFRRMRLAFGMHFSLDIRSRKDLYTVVELLLPLSDEKEG